MHVEHEAVDRQVAINALGDFSLLPTLATEHVKVFGAYGPESLAYAGLVHERRLVGDHDGGEWPSEGVDAIANLFGQVGEVRLSILVRVHYDRVAHWYRPNFWSPYLDALKVRDVVEQTEHSRTAG